MRIAGLLGIGLVFGVIGLVGVLALREFLRTLRTENWLIRVGREGLLVRLRSYRDLHLPEPHPTLLFIDRDEIVSVRGHVERYYRPRNEGSSETVVKVSSFLEIVLRDADSSELKRVLEQERKLPAAGGPTVRARSKHRPVSLPEPDVIRFVWRGASGNITPGLSKALSILREHYPVAGERRSDSDFRRMNTKDMAEHLLRLVDAGDTRSATAITRKAYHMSLSEARSYIDGLIEERDG
ncbi:MAG: hypothetical protein AAF533_16520 [Acidobacteriota bacterium]